MNTFFIYGIIMLFTGLIAFHVTNSRMLNRRDGFATASTSTSSPSLAASASNSSNNTPPPVPTGMSDSKKGGSTAKLSACGDDCSLYDEITKTLNAFNNVNKKHEASDDAIKKVDKDLIQLSKNVKNMGSKKTPGGKPPVNKAMLS
jgi:hypothetical protein